MGNGRDNRIPVRHEGRQTYVHVLMVEEVLGKKLPEGACVHHLDMNQRNNNPSNLVVCENQTYHMLLHRRAEALKACGDANKRKCWVCGKWKPLSEFYLNKRGYPKICKPCNTLEMRKFREKNRDKYNKYQRDYRAKNNSSEGGVTRQLSPIL